MTWYELNCNKPVKSNKAVSQTHVYTHKHTLLLALSHTQAHTRTHTQRHTQTQGKCNWKNWRSEVLHPNKDAETGTLLWAEQRRFTLSLVCELPRTFLIMSLPRPGKGLGSPRSTGTEKGPLCTTKEVTVWWFYLQLVLTWNIHTVILCESESLSGICSSSG